MPWALPIDTAEAVAPRADLVKNRSLFADKFTEFAEREEDKTARSRTIKRLVSLDFDQVDTATPRRDVLASIHGAHFFRAKLQARMIVNQAGGVIENSGLALDRNSGDPYIPGTALKGIARRGAAALNANDAEIDMVFGWSDSKTRTPPTFGGLVSFLAAYPVGSAPLEADILTAHHNFYYGAKPSHPCAYDNERPIPNEFPVIKSGSEFEFFLAPASAARQKQCDFDPLAKAKEWLIAGLTVLGVGAKTAAGYGWFEYDQEAERKREQEIQRAQREAEEARARAEKEAARKASMSPLDLEIERIAALDESGFANLIGKLKEEADLVQQAVIRSMNGEKSAQWKDWKKRKTEKTKKRADILEDVAKKHGVVLP